MRAELDAWHAAIRAAEAALDLFPPDTSQSLHRFGAETIVQALYKEAERRVREECAQIADRFRCGTCGMDGKIAEAIRKGEAPHA
jgi:hypothetical protein